MSKPLLVKVILFDREVCKKKYSFNILTEKGKEEYDKIAKKYYGITDDAIRIIPKPFQTTRDDYYSIYLHNDTRTDFIMLKLLDDGKNITDEYILPEYVNNMEIVLTTVNNKSEYENLIVMRVPYCIIEDYHTISEVEFYEQIHQKYTVTPYSDKQEYEEYINDTDYMYIYEDKEKKYVSEDTEICKMDNQDK